MSSIDFLAALMLAVSIFYFEDVDPSRKPRNTPQTDVLEEYDFIIVGAGTAGSVLANRLTEVEHWKVLLIEAGQDEDAITDTPALHFDLFQTQVDWNYTTVEQEYMCRDVDGHCEYPRGHVMGGSSTINGMFYVRGNRFDFDNWENLGNPGWSFRDVQRYFIKMESLSIPRQLANQTEEDLSLRGVFGPLTVQYPKYFYKTAQSVMDAAIEFGYIQGDYNGVNQERVGYTQVTVNGPSRESASKAYLNPIRHRKNLHVIKSTFVTKLLYRNANSVAGVQYVRNGEFYETCATKEVILSAGAINSPKILMLSGIGLAPDLSALDIPLVLDLPVGKNLQDHPLVNMWMATNHPAQVTQKEFYTKKTILEYAKFRLGPLAATPTQIFALKAFLNETIPNGNWFIFAFPSPNNRTDALRFGISVIRPQSRGSVKLRSRDPFDPPLIDPRYLTESRDMMVLREVVRDVLRIIRQPALARFEARVDPLLNTECAQYVESDEEALVDCLIARQSTTYYHPVGTARMGPATDTNSVVNENLTVHGMNNLRVIDASIMPQITTGNTNAPTYMIAEKGADMVKAAYGVSI